MNRQHGKALTHLLKLRRPDVFEFIKQYNLLTDVQNQALLLIEFDQDLQQKKSIKDVAQESRTDTSLEKSEDRPKHGTAIALLVDHTHTIPVRYSISFIFLELDRRQNEQINRVVTQLQSHRRYLFLYLDALFDKDPHLAFDHSDLQVDLYAEYAPVKLMEFLRASNYYSLEKVGSFSPSGAKLTPLR